MKLVEYFKSFPMNEDAGLDDLASTAETSPAQKDKGKSRRSYLYKDVLGGGKGLFAHAAREIIRAGGGNAATIDAAGSIANFITKRYNDPDSPGGKGVGGAAAASSPQGQVTCLGVLEGLRVIGIVPPTTDTLDDSRKKKLADLTDGLMLVVNGKVFTGMLQSSLEKYPGDVVFYTLFYSFCIDQGNKYLVSAAGSFEEGDKGQEIAWNMYCKRSPKIFSYLQKVPPTQRNFAEHVAKAMKLGVWDRVERKGNVLVASMQPIAKFLCDQKVLSPSFQI